MRQLVHILGFSLSFPLLQAEEPVDFNRDVRPILTKNCTTCHGGVKKAGDVSYLYREDTLGKGDSGKFIVVPGKPEESEMIARLLTDDPDLRMPPPDHHPKPLADKEVEILTRWIKEGAVWGEHWSFQKPEKPELPKVENADWPKEKLDTFILARLEAEGLEPSEEAGPEEWLRRASFDLTGLPPTPQEWESFKAAWDKDPQTAMEEAADRLLESPAYGEHWAAMWLDLARYSDTFGFEKDPHREIWPYRDWVIRAFNSDMPYDEFTIKQLGGDLKEDPDPFDYIASAFHRNSQNNTEGGTDDEEWRMAAVIDRVNTTWTAWNASTFGCVQCHAHPYDAIPHEDYYHFLAFFNNSEDVDLNSDWPRTKVANDPEMQDKATKTEKAIRQHRQQLNAALRAPAKKINDWSTLTFDKMDVDPATGSLTQQTDGIVIKAGTTPARTLFTLEADALPISLIRVEIFPEQENPAEYYGPGAVISTFEANYVAEDGTKRAIPLKEVAADFLAGPYDPNDALKKGAAGFGDYPMVKSPRTAWFIPETSMTPGKGERLEIKIQHGARCNESQPCVLPRFRVAISDDDTLVKISSSEARQQQQKDLEALQELYKKIDGKTIPVMMERSDAARRETRIFERGNRMTLGDVVEPNIPSLFDGPEKVNNRLEMAEWLVSDDNPLTARVMANRLWAHMFGIGIVETLEDFGSSGALPTHPELLDFLSLRLKDDHDWHMKPFLREIVLSAAYRQSNKSTAELIEKDPKNRLLARGPRQRLTAEMVRDQALLVSGLLTRKLYGPSVYPPQPDGIWSSVYSGAKWKTSTGEDRYRRALYTYHKRTASYPAFLTFDASSRDVCLARRVPTNTPLQALVTLNDPAHIEFAQAYAKRMMEAGDDLEAQLMRGYEILTLRDAEPETIGTLKALHADALAEYKASPDEAAKLAKTPNEAALVLVANTLLNSDLALNR